MECLELARKFAVALDTNAFATARGFLSNDCRYLDASGITSGADQIIEMYRTNYEKGAKLFDTIYFTSSVDFVSESEILIHYFDRVTRNGKEHLYRCDQRVRFTGKQISQIVHVELPGQREKLDAFKEG